MALVVAVMLPSRPLLAHAQGKDSPVEHPTFYRTIRIDGLSIFYREAGPHDAPTLLLLHGFPSSSRMFAPLFARLADRYHLVAPDYPGFGHSDWPDPKQFEYTFDHIASVIDAFTHALSLSHYTLEFIPLYGSCTRSQRIFRSWAHAVHWCSGIPVEEGLRHRPRGRPGAAGLLPLQRTHGAWAPWP
jgi:hypothetical protein